MPWPTLEWLRASWILHVIHWHVVIIPIVQPTRCTCYCKWFIIVKRSACFGLSVHHQELKTAYTATVYVKQLLLPAAIGDEMELQLHLIPHSSSCLTYTIAVYAVLSSWWWTERPSKTRRAFYKNKSFETTGTSCWFYRNILWCKDLWILNGVISMVMIQCGKCGVYIPLCKQMASTVLEYGVLCITHSFVWISFVLTIFESCGMLYLVEW